MCFIFLASESTFGQTFPINDYVVDTIHLKPFTVKKVVSYKINSVTICIKYEDYLKEHYKLLEVYKKSKGDHSVPGNVAIYKFLDSLYTRIERNIKSHDTVYLSQKSFDKVGLTSLVDFGEHIDSSTCAIFNQQNIRQYLIIRHTGKFIKAFDDGWGGKKYFLPNKKKYFMTKVNWLT
ncbi:MAG: hypothetical protein JWO92_427 [Chitinophagaceae bacterium]|nr:hypothetical protein [Chitinophagaceae bacterium]